MFKHQFKYTYTEGCEDFSPIDITFEIPGDISLTQMLYNFESYLKACGFHFDGHLEIINDADETYPEYLDKIADEETLYPADSDGWCDGEECGCESASSPLEDSKWTKAEKMLKEWNEGIAKLDNEQLQKAMKQAHEMSGLHYEATKEVKKNKWVHGICNPPSPDWKAQNKNK